MKNNSRLLALWLTAFFVVGICGYAGAARTVVTYMTKDQVQQLVDQRINELVPPMIDAKIAEPVVIEPEPEPVPIPDPVPTPVYAATVTGTDGAAIQSAINSISSGTVFVPDGVYSVDPASSIRMKSNVTLKLSAGAVLKVIPNNLTGSCVILFDSVTNSGLSGGTLDGNKAEHGLPIGEGSYYQVWNYGVVIGKGCSNITVSDMTIKDMYGDGLAVDDNEQPALAPQNITLTNVMIDGCRRTGMVLYSVIGFNATNCTMQNTGGCPTENGLDIEPNVPGQYVKNVVFTNCKFLNNGGKLDPYVYVDFGQCGVSIWLEYSGLVPKENVSITFDGCTASGNYRADWANEFRYYQGLGYNIVIK